MKKAIDEYGDEYYWKNIILKLRCKSCSKKNLECMSKEDYENIDDIAGHEVCTDELIFLQPWYDDTEDLKERFGKI